MYHGAKLIQFRPCIRLQSIPKASLQPNCAVVQAVTPCLLPRNDKKRRGETLIAGSPFLLLDTVER